MIKDVKVWNKKYLLKVSTVSTNFVEVLFNAGCSTL